MQQYPATSDFEARMKNVMALAMRDLRTEVGRQVRSSPLAAPHRPTLLPATATLEHPMSDNHKDDCLHCKIHEMVEQHIRDRQITGPEAINDLMKALGETIAIGLKDDVDEGEAAWNMGLLLSARIHQARQAIKPLLPARPEKLTGQALVDALQEIAALYLEGPHEFRPGDLVTWKSPLVRNKRFPALGEPAVVLEIKPGAMSNNSANSGDGYYGSRADVVVGGIDDGVLRADGVDSRLLKLWKPAEEVEDPVEPAREGDCTAWGMAN